MLVKVWNLGRKRFEKNESKLQRMKGKKIKFREDKGNSGREREERTHIVVIIPLFKEGTLEFEATRHDCSSSRNDRGNP